jgi:hypothetical protein
MKESPYFEGRRRLLKLTVSKLSAYGFGMDSESLSSPLWDQME